MGIDAGLAWESIAKIIIYIDRKISQEMRESVIKLILQEKIIICKNPPNYEKFLRDTIKYLKK